MKFKVYFGSLLAYPLFLGNKGLASDVVVAVVDPPSTCDALENELNNNMETFLERQPLMADPDLWFRDHGDIGFIGLVWQCVCSATNKNEAICTTGTDYCLFRRSEYKYDYRDMDKLYRAYKGVYSLKFDLSTSSVVAECFTYVNHFNDRTICLSSDSFYDIHTKNDGSEAECEITFDGKPCDSCKICDTEALTLQYDCSEMEIGDRIDQCGDRQYLSDFDYRSNLLFLDATLDYLSDPDHIYKPRDCELSSVPEGHEDDSCGTKGLVRRLNAMIGDAWSCECSTTDKFLGPTNVTSCSEASFVCLAPEGSLYDEDAAYNIKVSRSTVETGQVPVEETICQEIPFESNHKACVTIGFDGYTSASIDGKQCNSIEACTTVGYFDRSNPFTFDCSNIIPDEKVTACGDRIPSTSIFRGFDQNMKLSYRCNIADKDILCDAAEQQLQTELDYLAYVDNSFYENLECSCAKKDEYGNNALKFVCDNLSKDQFCFGDSNNEPGGRMRNFKASTPISRTDGSISRWEVSFDFYDTKASEWKEVEMTENLESNMCTLRFGKEEGRGDCRCSYCDHYSKSVEVICYDIRDSVSGQNLWINECHPSTKDGSSLVEGPKHLDLLWYRRPSLNLLPVDKCFSSSRKAMNWILSIIIVLLLGGVGYYFYNTYYNKRKGYSSPSDNDNGTN